jgi:hypothetical protein
VPREFKRIDRALDLLAVAARHHKDGVPRIDDNDVLNADCGDQRAFGAD